MSVAIRCWLDGTSGLFNAAKERPTTRALRNARSQPDPTSFRRIAWIMVFLLELKMQKKGDFDDRIAARHEIRSEREVRME